MTSYAGPAIRTWDSCNSELHKQTIDKLFTADDVQPQCLMPLGSQDVSHVPLDNRHRCATLTSLVTE
jgi:hypothetical protein